MKKSLSNKVALVTGGTKGIGRAIADKLSREGIDVIITARSEPQDNDLNHYFIKADHSKADVGQIILKEIQENFGKIDIIVNNAGANLTPGGGFNFINDEDWENEIQLNLMSAVRVNKALIPLMLKQKKGIIVNISMNPAIQPIWEMTMAYSASKAALNSYSKSLASELGPSGIRVNTVSPGLVKTPQMQSYVDSISKDSGVSPEEIIKNILDKLGNVPLGRPAEPSEIADLVSFLCSDESTYITGSIYQIDGGSLAVV
ncbi:SDR family oxidoreductase [Sphingobacterium oryzagri]|uniref:SDR family oxidoreductase n=1 Tax=Sphingobacterium oryzagri TaxID=3025669 RepID=A0ABY7WLM6_9SPHI|nr:SDR family oxidoreductase [Sphingobacterium sp. KACC 22765]WDF69220.1 SDR family oxidoreductase [Sphingobacterium sp. KACC 22765]